MANPVIIVQAHARNKAFSAIAEALREPSYCSHVSSPRRPEPLCGNAHRLREAIEKELAQPAVYRKGNQMLTRKKRVDSLVLLAGSISWPTSNETIAGWPLEDQRIEIERIHNWSMACTRWLINRFPDHEVTVLGHGDESHIHVHFFIPGNASRLHPGLCQQFDASGQRMTKASDKRKAYQKGFSEFYQEYHRQVASHFGMSLPERPMRGPRVKTRSIAQRILKIERTIDQIAAVCPELRIELQDQVKGLREDAAAMEWAIEQQERRRPGMRP
jgi:hypothetical protein